MTSNGINLSRWDKQSAVYRALQPLAAASGKKDAVEPEDIVRFCRTPARIKELARILLTVAAGEKDTKVRAEIFALVKANIGGQEKILRQEIAALPAKSKGKETLVTEFSLAGVQGRVGGRLAVYENEMPLQMESIRSSEDIKAGIKSEGLFNPNLDRPLKDFQEIFTYSSLPKDPRTGKARWQRGGTKETLGQGDGRANIYVAEWDDPAAKKVRTGFFGVSYVVEQGDIITKLGPALVKYYEEQSAKYGFKPSPWTEWESKRGVWTYEYPPDYPASGAFDKQRDAKEIILGDIKWLVDPKNELGVTSLDELKKLAAMWGVNIPDRIKDLDGIATLPAQELTLTNIKAVLKDPQARRILMRFGILCTRRIQPGMVLSTVFDQEGNIKAAGLNTTIWVIEKVNYRLVTENMVKELNDHLSNKRFRGAIDSMARIRKYIIDWSKLPTTPEIKEALRGMQEALKKGRESFLNDYVYVQLAQYKKDEQGDYVFSQNDVFQGMNLWSDLVTAVFMYLGEWDNEKKYLLNSPIQTDPENPPAIVINSETISNEQTWKDIWDCYKRLSPDAKLYGHDLFIKAMIRARYPDLDADSMEQLRKALERVNNDKAAVELKGRKETDPDKIIEDDFRLIAYSPEIGIPQLLTDLSGMLQDIGKKYTDIPISTYVDTAAKNRGYTDFAQLKAKFLAGDAKALGDLGAVLSEAQAAALARLPEAQAQLDRVAKALGRLKIIGENIQADVGLVSKYEIVIKNDDTYVFQRQSDGSLWVSSGKITQPQKMFSADDIETIFPQAKKVVRELLKEEYQKFVSTFRTLPLAKLTGTKPAEIMDQLLNAASALVQKTITANITFDGDYANVKKYFNELRLKVESLVKDNSLPYTEANYQNFSYLNGLDKLYVYLETGIQAKATVDEAKNGCAGLVAGDPKALVEADLQGSTLVDKVKRIIEVYFTVGGPTDDFEKLITEGLKAYDRKDTETGRRDFVTAFTKFKEAYALLDTLVPDSAEHTRRGLGFLIGSDSYKKKAVRDTVVESYFEKFLLAYMQLTGKNTRTADPAKAKEILVLFQQTVSLIAPNFETNGKWVAKKAEVEQKILQGLKRPIERKIVFSTTTPIRDQLQNFSEVADYISGYYQVKDILRTNIPFLNEIFKKFEQSIVDYVNQINASLNAMVLNDDNDQNKWDTLNNRFIDLLQRVQGK